MPRRTRITASPPPLRGRRKGHGGFDLHLQACASRAPLSARRGPSFPATDRCRGCGRRPGRTGWRSRYEAPLAAEAVARPRWRRGAAVERTARTAATVAAPATRPPAAAIAAVLTSPRHASTSVAPGGLREPGRLLQVLVLSRVRLFHGLGLEYGFLRHGGQSIGGSRRQPATLSALCGMPDGASRPAAARRAGTASRPRRPFPPWRGSSAR